MPAFLRVGPVFFSPVWRLSLGLALGFYPSFISPGIRGAIGLCGLAVTLFFARRPGSVDRPEGFGRAKGSGRAEGSGRVGRLGPGDPLGGLRPIHLAAFFLGLIAGSFLDAVAAGAEAPPWPAEGSRAIEEAKSGAGRPRPLAIIGISGRLVGDSRPARAGQRIMVLAADRVFVEGAGLSGSYGTKGRLRVLLREGPALASGAYVEMGGRRAAGVGELFFADRRDLILRDEGRAPARIRNWLHEAFLSSLLAGLGQGREWAEATKREEAGLLLALLAGWQDGLSAVDEAAFRAAGCTHILALSGQHLGIIAAGLAFVLRPLMGPLRALLPSLGVVSLYVFVVGPGPSLLRALISFGLASFATLADRPQDGRGILGLCFSLHAFIFPDQLREPGLVLSYLAVFGLVVLGPRLAYFLAPLVPPALATALSASLAAQLATAPWIALFFGIVQPVGILATLATALLVELVMIGGLVSALLSSILPPLAIVSAPIELFFIRLLEDAMRFFAALPSLSLPEGPARLSAALAIVLFSAFLYALPHVQSRSPAIQARL
ncbi:MAG TPA: ComEC/Rec2 family competence protein [Rectinemataceae bacterium]|nr:ComEC/Rec2 family competence protein [Rectinemataceae bacterium]